MPSLRPKILQSPLHTKTSHSVCEDLIQWVDVTILADAVGLKLGLISAIHPHHQFSSSLNLGRFWQFLFAFLVGLSRPLRFQNQSLCSPCSWAKVTQLPIHSCHWTWKHQRQLWIPNSRATPVWSHYVATVLPPCDNQTQVPHQYNNSCPYLLVLQHEDPRETRSSITSFSGSLTGSYLGTA